MDPQLTQQQQAAVPPAAHSPPKRVPLRIYKHGNNNNNNIAQNVDDTAAAAATTSAATPPALLLQRQQQIKEQREEEKRRKLQQEQEDEESSAAAAAAAASAATTTTTLLADGTTAAVENRNQQTHQEENKQEHQIQEEEEEEEADASAEQQQQHAPPQPSLRLLYMIECERLGIRINRSLAQSLPRNAQQDTSIVFENFTSCFSSSVAGGGAAATSSPIATRSFASSSASSPSPSRFSAPVSSSSLPPALMTSSQSKYAVSKNNNSKNNNNRINHSAAEAAALVAVNPLSPMAARRSALEISPTSYVSPSPQHHDEKLHGWLKMLSPSSASCAKNYNCASLVAENQQDQNQHEEEQQNQNSEENDDERITLLDCSRNFIGENGLLPLLPVLRRAAPTLERLLLDNCGLATPSVQQLLAVVSDMPRLVELDLRNNPISHEGGKLLHKLAISRYFVASTSPRRIALRVAQWEREQLTVKIEKTQSVDEVRARREVAAEEAYAWQSDVVTEFDAVIKSAAASAAAAAASSNDTNAVNEKTTTTEPPAGGGASSGPPPLAAAGETTPGKNENQTTTENENENYNESSWSSSPPVEQPRSPTAPEQVVASSFSPEQQQQQQYSMTFEPTATEEEMKKYIDEYHKQQDEERARAIESGFRETLERSRVAFTAEQLERVLREFLPKDEEEGGEEDQQQRKENDEDFFLAMRFPFVAKLKQLGELRELGRATRALITAASPRFSSLFKLSRAASTSPTRWASSSYSTGLECLFAASQSSSASRACLTNQQPNQQQNEEEKRNEAGSLLAMRFPFIAKLHRLGEETGRELGRGTRALFVAALPKFESLFKLQKATKFSSTKPLQESGALRFLFSAASQQSSSLNSNSKSTTKDGDNSDSDDENGISKKNRSNPRPLKILVQGTNILRPLLRLIEHPEETKSAGYKLMRIAAEAALVELVEKEVDWRDALYQKEDAEFLAIAEREPVSRAAFWAKKEVRRAQEFKHAELMAPLKRQREQVQLDSSLQYVRQVWAQEKARREEEERKKKEEEGKCLVQ